MRIDVVTPRFHPSVGGIEESVAQLGVRLSKRGHTIVVHTLRLRDTASREAWHGLEVRRYPALMDRGYYASRFEPVLEGDLIHLHAYAHHTNDRIIEKYAGRRAIVYSTHHGARFPKPRLGAKIYHGFYNLFVAIPNMRRVDALLVPTGYDAQYFSNRGMPSGRIHVLPTGADDAAFAPAPPWTPDGVPLGFMLYLGRLHAEKGIHDLLEALSLMPENPPVLLAGRDEGLLASLDVEALRARNVHVLTSLADEQKWGLLAACKLLVLPSRHEGQGIVLAEAWAKGKPVVATRAGALPWVIDDAEDGLLVPVHDPEALAAALQRVLSTPSLAHQLGEAGRRKAQQRFRWDAIVDQVEALYRSALENARRT